MNVKNFSSLNRELHPISVKLLKQGHPWVTEDAFSRRFPAQEHFVCGTDREGRPIAWLFHDPKHKTIRARLWDRNAQWNPTQFKQDLRDRLKLALEKRQTMPSVQARENYYIVFGEADQLPGLHILKLGPYIIIQLYAYAWENYREFIASSLQELLPSFDLKQLWWQYRGETASQQKLPFPHLEMTAKAQFSLNEFGVNYQLYLGESYDYGLYTDMAAVRFHMRSELRQDIRVLNLYSYTGAFSLYALKHGASQVTSIDLSPKYLGWLEDNLNLNPELKDRHRTLTMDCTGGLKKLAAEAMQFDLIICDPPTSSSDGNKRAQALAAYQELFVLMDKVLAPNGKVLSFLNTHQVTPDKFQQRLTEDVATLSAPYTLVKKFQLTDDCPTLGKVFPEGQYLKGLMWHRKAKV